MPQHDARGGNHHHHHLEKCDDEDDDPDQQSSRSLLSRERRLTTASDSSDDEYGRFSNGTGRRFSISSTKTWIRSRLPFPTRSAWSNLRDRYGPSKSRSGLGNTVRTVVFSSWANALLAFVPFAIGAQLLHLAPITIFALNALAIIPLTGLLTYATENVAATLGLGMGALLNIFFGNLVELIILIFMLQEGHLRLVLASLLGSIFVNLLFILGVAVVAGGLRNHEQLYSQRLTQILVYFMNVGVLSILIPTSLHVAIRHNSKLADLVTLQFSRGIAITLLVVYALYLHFMLRSRYDIIEEPDSRSVSDDGESQHERIRSPRMSGPAVSRMGTPSIEMQHIGRASRSQSQIRYKNEAGSAFLAAARIPLPPEEPEEEPEISRKASIVLLLVSAGVVSLCAELLVDSIEHVVANAKLTEAFLGLIILPLLGNTAELATAVTVSLKDNMDLTVNITAGSAIQVSLFMTPVMLILGWTMGKDLSMHLDIFQIVALLITVALVNGFLLNGRSHYLFGALLICVYTIIAIGAFVFPNQGKADIS